MKIFLFGSSGMLGRYVYLVLSKHYNVECINRKQYDIVNDNDDIGKLNEIFTDITNEDIIINCSGIIPQKTRQNDYKTYILGNTLFPHKLQCISKEKIAQFIHITTDCVFDGKIGNYNEDSLHTACDLYGISKSLGEPIDSTVIRTSIIGEELFGKKSLLEWVKSNKNGEINGYTNHYWNGVTCLTLANFIKNMIDNGNFWKGVKHIFSKNIVSKYDLCCHINEIYNLNIKINKHEDSNAKNMTLSGEFEISETIFEQIKNQHTESAQ
jgi:dTDP-4-dehydrorhamnose reductase